MKRNSKVKPEAGHARLTPKYLFSALLGRFTKDGVSILASGMVYSTIVALVPCVTFFVFFFGAFGVLDPFLEGVGTFLVETFGADQGQLLTTTISTMTKNAGTLGVFGIVSFMVTFILLINKFWTVANKLFRTNIEQNVLKRYLNFFMVLIVSTVILGLALGMTAKMSSWYSKLTAKTPVHTNRVLRFLGGRAVMFLILFWLTMMVPNTKVRPGYAAISAFTVTVALTILNTVFYRISRQMVKYSIIYGSLAVLFISILWLYIFWQIILTGFELCFVLQFRPEPRPERETRTGVKTLSDAFDLMVFIAGRYEEGRGAVTLDEMERGMISTHLNLIEDLRSLTAAGLLIEVPASKTAYVPGRPLDGILLTDIASAVLGEVNPAAVKQALPGECLTAEFRRGGFSSLGDRTLYDVIKNTAQG